MHMDREALNDYPLRVPDSAGPLVKPFALTSSGNAPAPPKRQGCAVSVHRFIVDCALPAAGGWSELAMADIARRLRVGPWWPARAGSAVAEHRSQAAWFRGCSYGCSSPGSGGDRVGSYAQFRTLADLREP